MEDITCNVTVEIDVYEMMLEADFKLRIIRKMLEEQNYVSVADIKRIVEA